MRMRSLCSTGIVALALLASRVAAQPASMSGDSLYSGWATKAAAGLSLNQSSFNQAWQGDEVGTVSWIATVEGSADRWLFPRGIWKNRLLLQFGQTHQQDAERAAWQSPLKSSDKILFRSIVLFKWWSFLDPFVAFDVDSQFFTEVEPLRLWWTPTVLTESVGLARYFVNTPRTSVLTRLGFAFKERIDRFGTFDSVTLARDTDITTEGGLEWYTSSRLATAEDRTVFTSELRLFKAVDTSQEDPLKRNYWASADVDWQNKLTNKIYKFISFDLFWQILYDKQINRVGQFKQTLGAGVTWQLI